MIESLHFSSLFVFSLKTRPFSAFVKSEAHFGVKAAAAAQKISNFASSERERERERENVGGGEKNDINEQ